MRITIATTSRHKAEEIRDLLADVQGLEILTLADYPAVPAPEEDGATMAANALIKARYYAAALGGLVLADDSGLEVDALNGAPGVHSARWTEGSDEDRTNALLNRLEEVGEEVRTARYRCSLCLASGHDILFQSEGTCEGEIALTVRGSNGFGYDPVFEISSQTGAPAEWLGHTLGEAPPAVKAMVSHRARAVRQLGIWLRDQA